MSPQGTPIVLLHGWGFTPSVWNPLIDDLNKLGLQRERIQTPALPLQPEQAFTQTIETLAAALPSRAHLVGWSLGGELALALAHAHPERLTSLTMISSTPTFMNQEDWSAGQPTALLDDFDQRLATNPVALLKRFSMLIRHGDAEASRDRALADALTTLHETDADRLASGLALLREIDLRPATPDVLTAALLIHGTHDAVTPFAAAAWLQQALPNATLQRIDGASHALPLTHAESTARIVAVHIAQMDSAAS
jgi:pimeloyl-[acyl-carrier protein] methyl ester esterase